MGPCQCLPADYDRSSGLHTRSVLARSLTVCFLVSPYLNFSRVFSFILLTALGLAWVVLMIPCFILFWCLSGRCFHRFYYVPPQLDALVSSTVPNFSPSSQACPSLQLSRSMSINPKTRPLSAASPLAHLYSASLSVSSPSTPANLASVALTASADRDSAPRSSAPAPGPTCPLSSAVAEGVTNAMASAIEARSIDSPHEVLLKVCLASLFFCVCVSLSDVDIRFLCLLRSMQIVM